MVGLDKSNDDVLLIERSLTLLTLQISVILLASDIVLGLLLIALYWLPVELPVALVLAVLITTKLIVTLYAITYRLMDLLGHSYYITGSHLIIREGIVGKNETCVELDQVKEVTAGQSWLGRRLNFGNLHIELASSGFHEELDLTSIKNPFQIEHFLHKYY